MKSYSTFHHYCGKCKLFKGLLLEIIVLVRCLWSSRYIVQVAAELGGVIISTDNYRDLLSENEAWRETIEQRQGSNNIQSMWQR